MEVKSSNYDTNYSLSFFFGASNGDENAIELLPLLLLLNNIFHVVSLLFISITMSVRILLLLRWIERIQLSFLQQFSIDRSKEGIRLHFLFFIFSFYYFMKKKKLNEKMTEIGTCNNVFHFNKRSNGCVMVLNEIPKRTEKEPRIINAKLPMDPIRSFVLLT